MLKKHSLLNKTQKGQLHLNYDNNKYLKPQNNVTLQPKRAFYEVKNAFGRFLKLLIF